MCARFLQAKVPSEAVEMNAILEKEKELVRLIRPRIEELQEAAKPLQARAKEAILGVCEELTRKLQVSIVRSELCYSERRQLCLMPLSPFRRPLRTGC
jgi:hypothetical protein